MTVYRATKPQRVHIVGAWVDVKKGTLVDFASKPKEDGWEEVTDVRSSAGTPGGVVGGDGDGDGLHD